VSVIKPKPVKGYSQSIIIQPTNQNSKHLLMTEQLGETVIGFDLTSDWMRKLLEFSKPQDTT